mmetsp:Transcript_27626/g.82396  ORF Transcript_27626/g.82396 Transcript_27626/m.82396 type:complete len:206 (-) Transcript_27626:65-682(-)
MQEVYSDHGSRADKPPSKREAAPQEGDKDHRVVGVDHARHRLEDKHRERNEAGPAAHEARSNRQAKEDTNGADELEDKVLEQHDEGKPHDDLKGGPKEQRHVDERLGAGLRCPQEDDGRHHGDCDRHAEGVHVLVPLGKFHSHLGVRSHTQQESHSAEEECGPDAVLALPRALLVESAARALQNVAAIADPLVLMCPEFLSQIWI